MDYQVILSDFFISDLQEIVEYLIEKADAATASRIGYEVIDRALEIGRHPLAGSPVKQRPGARRVFLYSYVIYYDVNEATHAVQILRVWHGARDPRTLRFK